MGLVRWKTILAVAVVALVVCGFSHWRYSAGYGDAEQYWRRAWAERDARDATALAQRQAAARADERRRQDKIDEIRKKVNLQLAGAKADSDRARAASRGLHDRADKLARRLAERERTCGTGSPGRGKAEASSAVLLADLFRRADERAGDLAREADEARARGRACEAAYGTIISGRVKR